MISMVPPYAWPRSIADLRDSSLNPDSFTPVDGTGYTPTGLDMGDPRMAGVFELGLRIADTMEKRVAVMEAIRQSVYGSVASRQRMPGRSPRSSSVPAGFTLIPLPLYPICGGHLQALIWQIPVQQKY